MFVCIGTNQLIEDSFGPRVGEILQKNFDKNEKVKVLGTMKSPIHFQNAPIFLDYLKHEDHRLILIDSALGDETLIGNTYLNRGGIEIGKAFGKSFYFPAQWNIKTIVGTKKNMENRKKINQIETIGQLEQIRKKQKIKKINQLAQKLAMQITETIYAII